MRRVRLTTDRAGEGWYQCAGDIILVPDEEAKRLVASLQAEYVVETNAVPAAPAQKKGK